MHVYALEA
jgi:hypothetical protein